MANATEPVDLEARIQQLENIVNTQGAEIQELRSASSESWMTQRRAEEVRALIGDVLQDADTRASLAGHGMTAGHNGGFFLASEDGNFLMNIGGQIQTRYIYNDTDDRSGTSGGSEDDETYGFQMRRAKLRVSGHVVDPRLTYVIQLTNTFGENNNDGNIVGPGSEDSSSSFAVLEQASFGYEFADGWQVVGGQLKGPFLREEAVDSRHQLAVERSFTADYFTIDYTQGVGVNWTGEIMDTPTRIATLIHDGSYTAGLDHYQELTDFAIAGRVEVLLDGSWDQFDDFTSSSEGDTGLMIGAAINWEAPNTGEDTNESGEQHDILKWTADVSYEMPEMSGFNAFAAIIGQTISDAAGEDNSSTAAQQLAFVVQAGVYAIPDTLELFARYEQLDFDGFFYINAPEDSGDKDASSLSEYMDEVQMLTLGMNYYFADHAAKFTLDGVWVFDNMPISDSGAGLQENDSDIDDDEQFAIRAQFQLLF
jgi:uncharacterized coiled-coil protein SlyX